SVRSASPSHKVEQDRCSPFTSSSESASNKSDKSLYAVSSPGTLPSRGYTLALEMLRCIMRRRQINRNFTKPEAIKPIVFSANSFEQMVKTLNISPEEYQSSSALKEWVRQNKDQKYV